MKITFALLLSICIGGLTGVTSAHGDEVQDKRSTELLNFSCKSDLGYRKLTLFANGTLRLKFSREGNESMKLAELTPDQVMAFREQLEAEDLSEVEQDKPATMSGLGLESCELRLRLWAGDRRSYRFVRVDSLPLNLSRVVNIAEALVQRAESTSPTASFSPDYIPQPGDILVKEDGLKFEVIGLTGDKTGVELEQLEQPITIYVPLLELVHLFVRVESRGLLR